MIVKMKLQECSVSLGMKGVRGVQNWAEGEIPETLILKDCSFWLRAFTADSLANELQEMLFPPAHGGFL